MFLHSITISRIQVMLALFVFGLEVGLASYWNVICSHGGQTNFNGQLEICPQLHGRNSLLGTRHPLTSAIIGAIIVRICSELTSKSDRKSSTISVNRLITRWMCNDVDDRMHR